MRQAGPHDCMGGSQDATAGCTDVAGISVRSAIRNDQGELQHQSKPQQPLTAKAIGPEQRLDRLKQQLAPIALPPS